MTTLPIPLDVITSATLSYSQQVRSLPQTLERGKYCLQTQSLKLVVAGKRSVKLTPLQTLLMFRLMNSRRPLTSRQLLDVVWGGVMLDTNLDLVHVNLSYLRQRLGPGILMRQRLPFTGRYGYSVAP